MAVVSIQLNSFSLQSTTVVASTITHDGAAQSQISLLKATRHDGEKLISSVYAPKVITISGTIKGTSQSNLDTNIDNFNRYTSVVEGNLDIEYAGSIRRYIVARQSITIQRRGFHLTFVPFAISFIVYDPPFGRQVGSLGGSETSNEFFTSTAVTSQSVDETFTFDGSAKPKPYFRFTVDRPGSLRTIRMRNKTTFQEIAVNASYLSGDAVVIDTQDEEVLINGQPNDYDGIFPEFELGANKVELQFIDLYGLDQDQPNFNRVAVIKGNHIELGQNFTVTTTGAYNRIEMLVRKNKDKPATGRLLARLWNTSASLPTTLIEQIVIDNEDIGEAFSWVKLAFTSTTLTAGTTYSVSLLPETGDEIFEVAYDDTGTAYAGYYRVYKIRRQGTWTASTAEDMAFKIFRNLSGIWSVDGLGKYTKQYL